MLQMGEAVRTDYHEAFEWYLKAAKQGLAQAKFFCGIMMSQEGELKNESLATFYFIEAAEDGLAAAQLYAGFAYHEGKFIKRDLEKAAFWLKKAAEQGVSTAEYIVGLLYLDGLGVSCEPDEAFKCFLRAANQGHPDAQFELGEMYYKGLAPKGGEKDVLEFVPPPDPLDSEAHDEPEPSKRKKQKMLASLREAFRCFSLAAEKGHRGAMIRLALMHENGEGVQKDREAAERWRSLSKKEDS